ncbi:hypothetical protein ASPVEDRAFT_36962 [Aspergillus versicolor CBS 583.65]|uniref:Kynurenine formamidase n=1 Tax=Aspergillus versicolor CBS 583.65 TaxID=1036611 RepID=A0A1L9P7M9_ASPVE|nr:uncharacterized protein ASPVEDRAFT_36962 [Aspergillus versicolor CBS 583.65]OJI97540.1 hypothetical protein ASPVEDRAFT_36962 [Aspergillus versicolor CBS 583.65]
MSLETFPYGDHDLQTVTVARPYPAPASTENDTSYWVILIHGGAWRDPTQTATSYLTPALSILSSQQQLQSAITGIASISYRLSAHPSHRQDLSNISPTSDRTAKHPDHVADIQTALSFLEAKYNIGKRYVLAGHSCGATLAFQAVMKPLAPLTSNAGAGYEHPQAILGMAGIYNLRLLRDSHKDISAYQEFIEGAFGDDENVWDAVSPGVVGVDAWEEGRVVVLAHSDSDELCDVAQSEGMKQRLRGWEEGRSNGQRKVHLLSIEGKHDEAWEKGAELARAIVFTLSRL